MSKTFSEFVTLSGSLLTLLFSENLTKSSINAYTQLTDKSDCKFELPQKEDSLSNGTGPLFQKSPYYHHFSEFTLDEKDGVRPNCLFSFNLGEYLKKMWMPYAPLWSSFVEEMVSNNIVESYFRHVKADIFQYKLRNKPGRVLAALQEDTEAKLNALELNFPKKKIKDYEISNEATTVSETWKSKIYSENWFTDAKSNIVILYKLF